MIKLAMVELRGLQFILSKEHRAQYILFLKQPKGHKQMIRTEARKHLPVSGMVHV